MGIAHSGTLISAILHLFRAGWRNPIARAAETMTVFAVCTAGLFPFIHLGRVWMVYYMLPVPNQRTLWPNFQSPLMFDVVAITTYLTVSTLFWYTGMLPDLAIIRDRADGLRKKIFTWLSLGWTGTMSNGAITPASICSSPPWPHHWLSRCTAWFPGILPLSVVPGWHTTIFAPYFVAGAIHSGLAMVLTLMIPLRGIFNREEVITIPILENVAKTIIFTGLIVAYSYLTEAFIAWYSGNVAERGIFHWRAVGHYALPFFWLMVSCNTIVPLAFLIKKVRTAVPWLFGISIVVNIGMWYERFIIIITSVGRDFLPNAWSLYRPSLVEFGIMLGSFSLFFFLFVLFVKHMPSVSMTEMKETLVEGGGHGH